MGIFARVRNAAPHTEASLSIDGDDAVVTVRHFEPACDHQRVPAPLTFDQIEGLNSIPENGQRMAIDYFDHAGKRGPCAVRLTFFGYADDGQRLLDAVVEQVQYNEEPVDDYRKRRLEWTERREQPGQGASQHEH